MGAFFSELMHVGIYKRSQGRIARQVTFAALAVVIALGLLRLSSVLLTSKGAESVAAWLAGHPLFLPFYWLASACAWVAAVPGFYLWFPSALAVAGGWVSYRLVNIPAFADFLIAVEAEMNKVSWPTRTELFRSTIVVLVMIFALGFFLAACDIICRVVLTALHVI